MPKIADIQETPNPNAVKFILKEPVSHGTSHSFKSAEAAADDQFARSIFETGSVVSVFYMDKMVTVEKTDDAEWDEILPELAVPIRAAEAVATSKGKAAAAMVGGAIAAATGAVLTFALRPEQRTTVSVVATHQGVSVLGTF